MTQPRAVPSPVTIPHPRGMSVVTVFAPEQKLRNHQVTGCVSLRAFRDILTELYSSAEFHPDMNALWDLRQADFSGILPEDVRELMHVVVSLWGRGGNCHSAVLVASATEFGIVRTYVSQFGRNAPCEIRVFLDPVEAHRWLGLGEATDVTNPRPRPPLNA